MSVLTRFSLFVLKYNYSSFKVLVSSIYEFSKSTLFESAILLGMQPAKLIVEISNVIAYFMFLAVF
ncbi:hypothetical protein MNBD_GAMMA07-2071 [hydrothermal vent metagenome]|uniref:Uncharacterized protein n=1 Tax=hydrothermal vent metagenome TaxID=652676 RepID=A0A3B0X0E1_9ZZZZ